MSNSVKKLNAATITTRFIIFLMGLLWSIPRITICCVCKIKGTMKVIKRIKSITNGKNPTPASMNNSEIWDCAKF